jgi:site-specific recombinase XerD
MTRSWSLTKKDAAPRGVRQLEDGSWGIRFACALKHLHKEKVGRVKREAINTYHARRARARSEPGWCPALERGQVRAHEARQMTFRAFAESFQAWRLVNRPRSCKGDVGRFATLIEHFGDRRLSEIAPLEIERFRDGLLTRGLAQTTSNRWRALLSALFTRAVRDGHLSVNPVRSVPGFKENNSRITSLVDQEEAAVLEALPAPFRPHFLISLNTGLRWAEQMDLRWLDVDLLTGIITIPLSKHGESRRVPMNSVTRRALLELATRREDPHDASACVFTPRPKQADSFFPRAVVRAQAALREAGKDASRLDGYVWHSNRHTFASRLVMAGVDIMTVKELCGWKTLAMAQRYIHLAPGHLHEAVERLASPASDPRHGNVPKVSRPRRRTPKTEAARGPELSPKSLT